MPQRQTPAPGVPFTDFHGDRWLPNAAVEGADQWVRLRDGVSIEAYDDHVSIWWVPNRAVQFLTDDPHGWIRDNLPTCVVV